jgi:hypothetical protein
MPRTIKQDTDLAYNITYVGPGYETIIVTTIYGADNALQLGALIAAGSRLNTVYAAISPYETELLAVWDRGARLLQRASSVQQRADTRANMSVIELLECGITPHVAPDTTPDGPCEITRWLEQQFGKGV